MKEVVFRHAETMPVCGFARVCKMELGKAKGRRSKSFLAPRPPVDERVRVPVRQNATLDDWPRFTFLIMYVFFKANEFSKLQSTQIELWYMIS
jgi:hypothetical protein